VLKAFEMEKGIAFEMEKGIPRQHYEVCNAEGEVIGEVTSGTMSPMLKKGIGMAYIEKASSRESKQQVGHGNFYQGARKVDACHGCEIAFLQRLSTRQKHRVWLIAHPNCGRGGAENYSIFIWVH